MITTKIGAGGFFIITDENGSAGNLIAAGPNTSSERVWLLRHIRDNVFTDNEGETVYNYRYFVNTAILFATGDQDAQANLVANIGLPGTTEVTEALHVKVDGSTLEYFSGKIRIKDGGVGVGKIGSSALEAGLYIIGAGPAAKVGVKIAAATNTLEFNGGGLRVPAQGIDSNELKNLGVTAAKLNADTKGAGVVAGGGTPMSIDVSGTSVTITGNALEVTPGTISGVHIAPGSLGVNEVAAHMKHFTIPIHLNATHQGANNDLKINKNFRILGVTGIITETIVVTGAANLTIEMIANGGSEITHSIPDATAQDTPVVFGAFASAPLDLTASDFTTIFNNLQFVLGNTGAGVTAGAVRLDIHCELLS